MTYYDALKTTWAASSAAPGALPPGVTGTSLFGLSTADKIAAINGWTMPGPNIDVTVPEVVGFLLLNGVYLPLASFASGTLTGNATHDNALMSAKSLMALVTAPNAPSFQMSKPATAAAVKRMSDALLAQELAAPNSTGFSQAVHDALLGLAATTVPWWGVAVADGGGGLSGSICEPVILDAELA